MTAWSRYLFGVSIVFGVGTMLLVEQLPGWWRPASVLFMSWSWPHLRSSSAPFLSTDAAAPQPAVWIICSTLRGATCTTGRRRDR